MMVDNKRYRVIVSNITWNPDGWRNLYVNPKAGHSYVRSSPGHESLNFYFKKFIDTEKDIFGYVQWTNPPQRLEANAVMIFYTNNLQANKGQIVGIYGDVKIVNPVIKTPHKGFEAYKGFKNDELIANITAKRALSLLFPIPLEAKKYSPGNRLVPQVGYIYKYIVLAEQVILDEIDALKLGGIRLSEYHQLKDIYTFITGKEYASNPDERDEQERDEFESLEAGKTREEIINDLKSVTPKSPEIVDIRGKQYRRDNKTVVQLKILRNYECQICNKYILKKDGKRYVEAAHITPKKYQGPEAPNNLLILCPNHHKEFDLGNKQIDHHDTEKIIFKLNGITYTIKLSLE